MTEGDINKMVKVEVLVEKIVYTTGPDVPSKTWTKGQVLEMKAIDAAGCLRRGRVKQAVEGAQALNGEDRQIDALDVAVRSQDFELAKQLASGIRVPDAAADPKDPPPIEKIPEQLVAPMKSSDFGR